MRSQKIQSLAIAAILLAALFTAYTIAPAAAQETSAPDAVTGTVAAGITLNVREGPGLQYPAFTTLAGSQGVTLIGRDSTGAWLQMRLADGRIGWSSSQFLESESQFDALPLAGAPPDVPAATAPGVGGLAQGTVTNANILNVRTGPGLDASLLTTLTLSQTVTLEGRDANGAWLQVRLPDNRLGWVSSEFITPNLDVATLPLASPTETPLDATTPVTPTTPAPGDAPADSTETQTFDLNVRTGPGLNYPVLATLPEGQTVELQGRNADSSWLLVRTADGDLGWVNSAVIATTGDLATLPETTLVADTATPGVGGLSTGTVVNANLLNVRSGPGLDATILTTLPLGESVVLEGRNADSSWLQVRLADGRLGWVSSEFITANLDIANLPVTG